METISVHITLLFCFLPGVADGVGGWRDYGVDPSQFSGTLMRTCERLVKEGRFVPSNPVGILTAGYCELLQNKVPLLGKRTQIHKLDHSCCMSLRWAYSSCFNVTSIYNSFAGISLNYPKNIEMKLC